jgi:hypothetical protein
VGDVLDPIALALTLEGAEAVVSALGTPVSPFREVTLPSVATRIPDAGMQRQGLDRRVAIRAWGDAADHGDFLFDWIFKLLMLRKD